MPSAIGRVSTPLAFRFKNIGPIKDAELELGDLTIIAGRNNTGKTYLVYTLYGFLTSWADWPGPSLPSARVRSSSRPRRAVRYPTFEVLSEQVAENGQAEFAVDRDALSRERNETISALAQRFSRDGLARVFSSSPETFEGASIRLEMSAKFPGEDQGLEAATEIEDTPSIRYDGTIITVVPGDAGGKRYHPVALRRRLWRQYLRFLLPELPTDPFVLSAERFGISLFYKELDFRKSQLVDLLQKYGDSKTKDRDFPFLLIGETLNRYASPVKDNIDYTRSISDFRNRRSEVYGDGFFNDIKKMMNGYYTASRDEITFRSIARGDRGFAIPLHLASSSVRGLSDLYFFLRHVAQKNHLIVIDEPESHLDTANQILLARLLARLIQAGLKVLLTTHSDYLIKELNNLIMLSRSFRNKSKVTRKLKYSRDDYIVPERIRAYVAANGGIAKCEIDKLGIDMPNFDETINEINDVANELAIRVSEDSTD